MTYKDYSISEMDTIYIGKNKYKYDFVHKDYDGAPDAYDNRKGIAISIQDAKDQIDEIIADENIV